jgi:hypothetical protein
MATKAYNFTRGWNSAQTHLNSVYKTANTGRVIPIKNDPVFISKVPEHWRPRNIASNFNANIRNVAKLQAYRSSRSRAYKNAAANNPKKQMYLLQLMRAEAALLTPKYRKYLDPNFANKIAAKYAKRSEPTKNLFSARPITSHNMGASFIGKILKFRPGMRVSPGKPERVAERRFSPSRITNQQVKRENKVYPSNMSSRYLNSLSFANVRNMASNFATTLPRRNLSPETRNKKMKEFGNFRNAWKSSEHSKKPDGKKINTVLKELNAKLKNIRTAARSRTVAPNNNGKTPK